MKTDFLKNALVRALIALVLGIVLLIFPTFVANSLVRIVGAVALIMGVVSIVKFFREKSNATLVAGIIEAVAGLFLLIWPDAILKVVFIVLALVLLIFAVEEIIRLVKSGAKWQSYVLPAAMVILGVIIFFQPASSMRLVVILFGVALIVYAVSELVTSAMVKKNSPEA